MHDLAVNILKDKAVSPSVLLAIAVSEYGTDCFDWEPDLLRLEILEDFGVELSPSQSDKLQAAITVISTDQFENDWMAFNNCIHALNGEPFEHDLYDPVDAEQIAAVMPEIEVIRNQFTEEGIKFSDEVNTYAGFVFSEYGLFFAPNEFSTALMPSLEGEHYSDSQTEKQEALAQIYTAKKDKIKLGLAELEHVFKV
jgi:hypothetical protein